MSFEDIVDWTFSGEEFKYMDKGLVLAGKETSSIGKDDLTAPLVWKLLVLLNAILKDIHHSDSVIETNNNLETSWMERYTKSFFLIAFADFKVESHGWVVTPNLNCFVR